MDNEFGEQWTAFAHAARAYLDGAAKASASGPGPAEPARIFGDVLRELFANINPPWNSGPWNFGSTAGPGLGSSAAVMPDSPALGATREHQQRSQRMADAWRRLDEAQRRLQRLWSDALREAAATFAANIGASQISAPSADAVRALYDQWIDCAEDAYSRAAHSEIFCTTLAEHVNASSEWRRELRATIEQAAKLLDLPTRSEINTLAQRLKSVEAELRAERAATPTTRKPTTRKRGTPKAGKPKTSAIKQRSARRKVQR